MTAQSRLLDGVNSPPPRSAPAKDTFSAIESLKPDLVVIVAGLLCALICVLGLVSVARCALLRRIAGRSSASPASPTDPPPPPLAANRGLRKKVLNSLPKFYYGDEENQQAAAKLSDCAICLAEFVAGEEVRVLPQCGYGFHVVCIDTWLGSHSSCPSCRQILEVARCRKCGRLPASTCSAAGDPPIQNDGDTFLP